MDVNTYTRIKQLERLLDADIKVVQNVEPQDIDLFALVETMEYVSGELMSMALVYEQNRDAE